MGKQNNPKKMLYGVAINDAGYTIRPRKIKNGRQEYCPFYKKWKGMLNRVYDKDFHERQPSYKNCSICEEWLTFSNFKKWMEKEDWEGKQLDKDIRCPNNKHYSPETCCFIPRRLNTLLRNNERGPYPKGVGLYRATNKYISKINIDCVTYFLGMFKTIEEAEKTYKKAKIKEIKKQRDLQTDVRIIDGLNKHIKLIKG